ncbi:MAG: metallophosphoesterase [Marinomonas sp.]
MATHSPTRIFHCSDVHFGVENRAALDAFAKAAKEEGVDAVLCTGDVTQRAKHSEFADARDYFAQFECPVVLCPGNHDMPYYNMWERFTDPYLRFRRMKSAIASDVFRSPDIVFVPLKSTVRIQPRFPWSDGFVTDEALAETLAHLKGLKSDPRQKLVICHHPLLGENEDAKNPTIGGDDAFAALAAAGGDAVISGHVHIPFDLTRQRGGHSMRMLGVGTLSTRLRGAPPSYRVLTCALGRPIEEELRTLPEHTD